MKNKLILLLISGLALTFSATQAQSKPQTGDHKADTLKCAGITSKGLACRSTWIEQDGYCRSHNPNKITCGQKKANGEPCKNVVTAKGDLCHVHKTKLATAVN